MRDHRPASAAARDEQSAQTKIALGAMLVPLFFVIMFATCIIGTYHKPSPNGIKVGVVGPVGETQLLRTGIQRAGGSAFDIRSVASLADAVREVSHRNLNAAFVPSAGGTEPGTVVVASAAGRLVAATAETLARTVTAAQGEQLVVRDVSPLPAGDEIGLGIFMFVVVLTICGYLAPTILGTVTPALGASRRYAIIAANAVLISSLAYLIAGLGYGTYTGSFGTIVAFIGVGALYAFAIGLGTRLFQVVLGPSAGLFASLTIFVFLNVPSLGATYTATMLSPFWRLLNRFWIGAGTVNAARSILYFQGHGVDADVLRLLAWTGGIVALLALVSWRLGSGREDPSGAVGKTLPPQHFLEHREALSVQPGDR